MKVLLSARTHWISTKPAPIDQVEGQRKTIIFNRVCIQPRKKRQSYFKVKPVSQQLTMDLFRSLNVLVDQKKKKSLNVLVM